MDFSALSRRELQGLCKLNGVRANMTKLAMAEALHSLPSVEGIDQIGTTLCLPTPGKSAMKSVLRAAGGEDQQQQQQQRSPLPRGRRVSVKSPEAVRMERDVVKEIVRTPGVALRSTSRRLGATPAPVPTPAAGTLRRSQRSTRKSAKLNMVIDFDQDEEVREQEKAQEVEPKGVTSDVKCDEPEEEKVTMLLEVNSKADEPKQGEEGAAIEEEQKLVNAEKFPMEDSPILGVLSKVAPEPAMKNVETEDGEGFGNWSPVLEMADEINSAGEDKEDAVVEVPKEDAFGPTVEAADASNKMIQAAVTEKEVAANEFPQADPTDDESAEEYDLSGKSNGGTGESSEEDDLDEDADASEDKEDAAAEVPKEAVKEDAFNSTVQAAYAPNKMIPAAVTEKEVTADEFPQADPHAESADEYDLDGESSDEAGLIEDSSEEDDRDEEDMENVDLAVDEESSDEAGLIEENSEEDDRDKEDMENVDLTVDEESDETIEASNSTEVNFDSDEEEELKMLETGEKIKEYEESDSLTGEEDDFTDDLSSEFDNVDDFSYAETENNNSPVALEGIHAAASSSAAKTDDYAITEEGDEVSQHVETIVESLDKVTITEEKECAKEKKQLKVGKEMSLRKLKSAYKERLIAAKEGKKLSIDADEGSRVALAELDDNVEC